MAKVPIADMQEDVAEKIIRPGVVNSNDRFANVTQEWRYDNAALTEEVKKIVAAAEPYIHGHTAFSNLLSRARGEVSKAKNRMETIELQHTAIFF